MVTREEFKQIIFDITGKTVDDLKEDPDNNNFLLTIFSKTNQKYTSIISKSLSKEQTIKQIKIALNNAQLSFKIN